MKFKILLVIPLTLLAALSLTTKGYNENSLLTETDLLIEEVSNKGGPPLRYKGEDGRLVPSYSHWQCFDDFSPEVYCLEHYMPEVIKIPMIEAYMGNEAFQMEPSAGDGVDCESTAKFWNELISEEKNLCVLASYLQEIPLDNITHTNRATLWIVEAIKTSKGYWLTPVLRESLLEELF